MKLLSKLRWGFFDWRVRMLRDHTAVGQWLHYEAWSAGWEARSKLGGPPACPSDYYKRESL